MDWFLTVVQDHYADVSGRARRAEYWMFQLVSLGLLVGIGLLAGVLLSISDALGGVAALLLAVAYLALLVPSVAVLVRRLHDTGRSGWWYWISLVPVVGGCSCCSTSW